MLHPQQKRADTASDRPGGQMNRHVASPAVTDLGDKCKEMLHDQRKSADTTSDRPGRHMNRNAAWRAGFAAGLSPTSFPGWLVSHFLSFVSHFFSFVSQAGRLWSGSRLACLPLPFMCLPLLFICRAGCLWSGLRLACLPRAFICLPLLSFVSQFFSFVSQFFSFFVSQAG